MIDVELKFDNQSAIDFCRKSGLGKSKHINTGLLWLQDAIEKEKVKLVEMHIDTNLAGDMTKYLPSQKRNFFLNAMRIKYQGGHHPLALRA